MALKEINAVGIDTPFGYRTFVLCTGSIADAEADLRIVSTHANPALDPTGSALGALGLEGILTNEELDPLVLLVPGSVLGTWRATSAPQPTLVVRIPGRGTTNVIDAWPTYERAVRSVFIALAAMELDGDAFPNVAMTVLAGSRGYEVADVVRTLFEHAHRWLQRSRSIRTLSVVVADHPHLEAWADALDDVLSRRSEDVAGDRVVEALATEILARLESPLFATRELHAKVTEPFRQCLDGYSRHQMRVNRLAVPGRVLAEYAVLRLETAASLKKAGAGDLYGRIETLLQNKLVQPWVGHHLHALRLYGNETVHFTDDQQRRLESRDVPGLLASALRVLQHLQDTPA